MEKVIFNETGYAHYNFIIYEDINGLWWLSTP